MSCIACHLPRASARFFPSLKPSYSIPRASGAISAVGSTPCLLRSKCSWMFSRGGLIERHQRRQVLIQRKTASGSRLDRALLQRAHDVPLEERRRRCIARLECWLLLLVGSWAARGEASNCSHSSRANRPSRMLEAGSCDGPLMNQRTSASTTVAWDQVSDPCELGLAGWRTSLYNTLTCPIKSVCKSVGGGGAW